MVKTKSIFHLIIIISTAIVTTIPSCKNDDLSEMFIIKDTSSIQKVIIEQGIKTLTIKREESDKRWMINDKYPATEKSIRKLMQTFIGLKIDKTVPSENIDSIIKAIESNGRTISIYGRRDKAFKIFKTGAFDDTYGGTYMMESEKNIPCVVNIPGLENDLNNRFSLQYIYWIKPLVFSYGPGKIKEINVEYSSAPERSFRLNIDGSTAHLFQISENKEITPLNNQKIGNYLSYFMNVKFSDIDLADQSQINALFKKKPQYTISVKDINNKLKTVKLFTIPDKNDSTAIDINKMNALINDEDIVTVTYFDMDLLLKDIDYFIK